MLYFDFYKGEKVVPYDAKKACLKIILWKLPFKISFLTETILAGADESYHGMGSMKCYGDMSVTLGSEDGQGFLDCQPAWGSAAAPPQVSSVHRPRPPSNNLSSISA